VVAETVAVTGTVVGFSRPKYREPSTKVPCLGTPVKVNTETVSGSGCRGVSKTK